MQKSNGQLDKRIIIALTICYILIGLVNLGSFAVPQTGWTPQHQGEQFTVIFEKPVQIDKIMLFGGLGPQWGAFGSLEMEAKVGDQFQPFVTLNMDTVFHWYTNNSKIETDQLRIRAIELVPNAGETPSGYWQAEYRELAFFENGVQIPYITINNGTASPGVQKLFDEQKIVPERGSYMNSTYFDEIYFVRTALEHLEKREIIYENTHPPLGKNLIALSISILGFFPFAWRILGMLIGAAMIPLMYMMAKRLFKDSFWALFSAWLLAFDFMHFTQTRIATIDGFCIFFIMAMYYSMLIYMDTPPHEKGFAKSLIPLFFSGLFLGLGSSVKWIALYGAFGLAFLFFKSLTDAWVEYKDLHRRNALLPARTRKELPDKDEWWRTYVVGTCGVNVFLFILLPIFVYALSYLPIIKDGTPAIKQIVDSQVNMFNYHKNVTATHPFSSNWYEWPFDTRPIFYYAGNSLTGSLSESIASFGNPLVWWSGLLGFLYVLSIMIGRLGQTLKGWAGGVVKRSKSFNKLLWFPFIGFLSEYLPWVFSPRKLTFIYHYFACVPFIILMAAAMFRALEDNKIIGRRTTILFMVLVAILFVVFYPVLSGMAVPRSYLVGLQWFQNWDW